MKFKRILALLCLVSVLALAQEKVDLATLHKIKEEAFQHSQVMDTMFQLTDVHGPRLTNSPAYFGAADWVVKQMTDWGMKSHQEKWPFGRGWEFTKFSAHLIEPQYAPLIGFPLAWTAGTNGVASGEPMMIEALANDADLEKYKGKIKGKIIMIGGPRELQMSMTPLGRRYTDQELAEISIAPDPGAGGRGPGGRGPGGRGFQQTLQKFLATEQPALILRSGTGRSEGGTVFGASSAGSRDAKDPVVPSTVLIAPEHYNRICRLIEHKIPVKLEFEVQAKFQDERTDSVDVLAEIEGGRKRDEVVMLGGHLDSWHAGTGATDNAAGSAVMIEAMRILKTLDLKMDRTVRMGLWGGEEEGLLGSRAYVKEHFADPETMKTTTEHAKLSGYFNIDNGTGKVRGVYLQGNDMMRPIFEQWFAPLKDLTNGTISIRNTGGTDHLSFDAVGLPGFQFIQDPMEYDTRTHHSNMDTLDRIQKGDMMQMAAIVASFVYNTATREEMLPRKPLPKPQPRRDQGGRGGPTQQQN
jgi:carboxypeptidase Q